MQVISVKKSKNVKSGKCGLFVSEEVIAVVLCVVFLFHILNFKSCSDILNLANISLRTEEKQLLLKSTEINDAHSSIERAKVFAPVYLIPQSVSFSSCKLEQNGRDLDNAIAALLYGLGCNSPL